PAGVAHSVVPGVVPGVVPRGVPHVETRVDEHVLQPPPPLRRRQREQRDGAIARPAGRVGAALPVTHATAFGAWSTTGRGDHPDPSGVTGRRPCSNGQVLPRPPLATVAICGVAHIL